jgi:predicted ATPase/DNA-binding SARP family transcriptional activator
MTTTAGPPAAPVLPPDWTSFVGRETELEAISTLLTGTRLLTLTGAGGSGKTRLAREVLSRHGPGPLAPAAWVELAPLEDPALLPRHVASAFGVSEEVGSAAQLAALLRARVGLAVLDNCEHLVDACADLAHALLAGCPDLRILATSREALGVKGERTYPVPPLAVPAPAAGTAAIGAAEAVRLFTDRARDALPSFDITDANAGVVAEICLRLDGIPLALELAAARTKSLSLAQIRDRLDDAFRVLATGGRTAIPRHRTLRAAIDWSHDLLPPRTQAMFRRLAVFRGGFTLDAAEVVCVDGVDLASEAVLDEVARLVDRSLLEFREEGGAARYRLLETVRQYAALRLDEAGEAASTAGRHASYMMGLVASLEADLTTPRRRRATGRLSLEMDNLREALLWTRAHDGATHVRLVGGLWWFWYPTRHWLEAGRWIHEALTLPEAERPGPERAGLLFAAGALSSLQGRTDAARPLLREAAVLAAEAGDRTLEAHALTYLGHASIQEMSQEGRAPCERAAAWFRESHDDFGLRLALLLLGHAAFARGDLSEAFRLHEEAVAVARRFGEDRELVMPLQTLALLHIRTDALERAEPLLMESFAASRRDPSYIFVATSLDFLAECRIRQGRVAEAGRYLGAAEAIRERIGATQYAVARAHLDPLVADIRAGADGEAFRRHWATGRGLTIQEILDEVLATVALVTPDPHAAEAGDGPASAPTAAPDAPHLRVRTLGRLQVQLRGEPVDEGAWAYAKPRELLVYLAVHRGGRSRAEIGRAIWPTSSPAQAKNSFHVSLHHLRKTLGDSTWILTEDDRCRIADGIAVELDAERFENEARLALQQGDGAVERLREARSLYTGDFLDGETAGPWHEEHRSRLLRLWADVSLRLAAALEAAGDDLAAAAVYHEVVVREELDEAAHRGLMRTWARTGERARALRHYDRLVAFLRDELECDPEPETVQVRDSLRGSAAV